MADNIIKSKSFSFALRIVKLYQFFTYNHGCYDDCDDYYDYNDCNYYNYY